MAFRPPHPFADGNGRVHRFLVHYVLACLRFVPNGAIFPVSAYTLRRKSAYDARLEAFSKPLLPLMDFTLDTRGRLSVQNKGVLSKAKRSSGEFEKLE